MAKTLTNRKIKNVVAWLPAAAGAAAAAVLVAARGNVLHAAFAVVVGFAVAGVVGSWLGRRSWLGPLLFWAALSLPFVKHVGAGVGMLAVNADHLIIYPVDVVLVVLFVAVLAPRVPPAGTFGAAARSLCAALGRLVRPDFVGYALIALGAAAVLSSYEAPRPALVAFALVDLGRWYLAYIVFRELAAGGGRGVATALLAVVAAQGLLCAVEFFGQNNFGLWEKPGWGAFITPFNRPRLARLMLTRGGGTYEPNVTAFFLQMALPFAGVYFLAAGRVARRWLSLAGGAVTLVALFVTFSRGGWLGAGAALGVLLVAAWALRRRLAAPTWALVAATALAFVMMLPAAVVMVARGLGGDSMAAVSRVTDWRIALAIFRDHPWLGIGKANYLEVQRFYNPLAFAYPVHNFYLLALAETGALGAAALLVYLYGALRAAARAFAAPAATDVAFAAAAFAAFAGVAVRMFVSMSFLHPFVSLTFAALAGAVAALGARRGRG